MTIKLDFSKDLALSLEPKTLEEETIQSIYLVLNTYRGEVPCYREFGIDSKYIHKPIDAAQTMFAAAITEAIERFVPGVKIKHISFENDADSPSTLCPILEVTILE